MCVIFKQTKFAKMKSYRMCQNFSGSVGKILREVKRIKSENVNLKPNELILNGLSRRKRPLKISVEGNIASGKSTFLKQFSKYSEEIDILPEPVELWRDVNGHNLLELMYNDPQR